MLPLFVAFYVLLYIAGPGRLPWRIKVRDYLIYVLISVGVVGIVQLIALYEAQKTRRPGVLSAKARLQQVSTEAPVVPRILMCNAERIQTLLSLDHARG